LVQWNCNEAIEFYQKAFDAKLQAPVVKAPNGKGVLHAMLRIGNSNLIMADAWPGWEKGPEGSTTIGLWVYVEDVDSVQKQAVDAGCEIIYEVMDAFWGDRTGKVKDPFGHTWAIATHKWIYTPEEIQKGQDEWMAGMKN